MELMEEKARRYQTNKIDGYYPDEGPLRRELYPKHMEFFAAGLTYRERCAMCANRVGKCCTSETIINTKEGYRTVGELYTQGEPFEVEARPGVFAKASAPFKKPRKEQCLRFEMSDGQWFECAMGHRVLTTEGWFFAADYVQLSRLRDGFSPDPLLSSLGYGPSVHDTDGPRSTRTPQDFSGRYSDDPRQCGEQLPDESDTDLSPLPSLNDAPACNPAWLTRDDLEARYTNTPSPISYPLPNLGGVGRRVARSAEWLDSVFGTTVRRLFDLPPISQPLPVEVTGLLQSGTAFYRHQILEDGSFALNHVPNSKMQRDLSSPRGSSQPQHGLGSGRKLKIVLGRNPLELSYVNGAVVSSVYSIGAHDVYDFSVETHKSYVAGGVIHHNTEGMGGYETALHLTGQYPEWWPGRRFTKPVDWWAVGKTNQTTRDIVQYKLMGKMGELGQGLIRQDCIGRWTRKTGIHDAIDTVQVKHVSGAYSVLGFKSYEQGRDSFEGTEKDGIWDDEEPPQDVYGEQLIRTATTNGMMLITFTPLLGMSQVVMGFMPQESRLDV
jgi:phage terminase large subunit-like protein